MTGEKAEGLVVLASMETGQVLGRFLCYDAGPNEAGSVRVNTKSSRNVTVCEGDPVLQSSLAAFDCVRFGISPI